MKTPKTRHPPKAPRPPSKPTIERMRDAIQPATRGPVIQDPPGGIAKVVKGPTEKPPLVKPIKK